MKSWRDWLGIELSAVSLTEKLVSFAGGLVAIGLLVTIVHRVLHVPFASGLIASMGASAVLLFAVPHGQLSQPWPVIGGHVISALVGVTCAQVLPWPELAAGCAVGIAIGLMHHLKCIHPPGGATALVAALAGSSIGYGFVVFPVLLNALAMVAVAVVFNYSFPWRRYPAVLCRRQKPTAPPSPDAPTHEEVVAALRQLDSFVDITEDDLLELARLLDHRKVKAAATNSEQLEAATPSA